MIADGDCLSDSGLERVFIASLHHRLFNVLLSLLFILVKCIFLVCLLLFVDGRQCQGFDRVSHLLPLT